MLHRFRFVFRTISLLLCLTAAVLWIRSYRHIDGWSFTRDMTTWDVTSFGGWFRVMRIEGTPIMRGARHRSIEWGTAWPRPGAGSVHPLLFANLPAPTLGFVVARTAGGLNPCGVSIDVKRLNNWSTARLQVVVVPDWFLFGCFAVPSLCGLYRFAGRVHRSALRQQNQCVKCGYDLRATPQRCPECGTEVAAKADSYGA